MCGLVGVAFQRSKHNTWSIRSLNTLRVLLDLDTIRGPHSTGVGASSIGGETPPWCRIVKSPVPGDEFVRGHHWDKIKDLNGPNVFIGHNRYATMGGRGVAQAHPFLEGQIMGCHNGTLLRGFESYLEETHTPALNDLDSARIMASLNKATNPVDVLKELQGSYALVWVDGRTGTLNLARNDERPLWYAWEEGALYWASAKWMLEAAFSREYLGRSTRSLTSVITKLPETTLHTYDLDTMDIAVKDKEIYVTGRDEVNYTDKVVVRPIVGAYSSNYSGYPHQWKSQWDYKPKEPEKDVKPASPVEESDTRKANELLKPYDLRVGAHVEVAVDDIEHLDGDELTVWVFGTLLMPSTTEDIPCVVEVTQQRLAEKLVEDHWNIHTILGSIQAATDNKGPMLWCRGYSIGLQDFNPKEAHQKKIIKSGDKNTAVDLFVKLFGTRITHPKVTKHTKYVKGPRGTQLTEEAFNKIKRRGCSMCGDELTGSTHWSIVNDKLICNDCYSQDNWSIVV